MQAARGSAGQHDNVNTQRKSDSDLPCLFWRGSKLASSSLESVEISAMLTTDSSVDRTERQKVAGCGAAGAVLLDEKCFGAIAVAGGPLLRFVGACR